MTDGWTDNPATTGGCQCGAVRYTIAAARGEGSICHCRMCQRASGGPFAAFHDVRADAVTWHGKPATWASSEEAERGFCATCGTPLFFRYRGADTVELMAGTLHPSFPFRPVANCAANARVGWLAALPDLPDRELPVQRAAIHSRQAPEET